MSKKLVIIAQNECGSVENSDSMMTYGINTCCALVVYNRQKTFLAHIDAFTDLGFITTMVADEFKGEKPKLYLFRRNGNVFHKVASKLKELGLQFTLRDLDQDKPNLMIANMAISYPDRLLVNTVLNNPQGIPEFLGFQPSEININGGSFLERAQNNHHVILNCMVLKQDRPIVRVCTDSVFTQQSIPMEQSAQTLVSFHKERGEIALANRLLQSGEANTMRGYYTVEAVVKKIDDYVFLCQQMSPQLPTASTSLTSNIPACSAKTAVIVGLAICAVALSYFNHATQQDMSR
jgi:hypothetical protein